jgi:GTPase SAR1 family protein
MSAGYDHQVLKDQSRKTNALADGLASMANLVGERLNLSDLSARLQGRADSVRADKFRVVVVGAFSRGKSTLMNALLGDSILPQKVNPSTAIITVVEFAEQPSVRIKYNDGKPDRVNLSIDNFCKEYVLNESDMSEPKGSRSWEAPDEAGSGSSLVPATVVLHDRFSDIDHAIVYYPLEICRYGVDVVDSPGLQAHPLHTARTLKFLKSADAVVMVLDATALLDQQERHFLETVLLPERLRNIFFLVNKWNLIEHHVLRPQDLQAEYDRIDQRIREQITPFCVVNNVDRSAERVFRVNLFGAIKARLQKPVAQADLEKTGVPSFEQALQNFLVHEKGRARNEVVLGVLNTTAEEVRRFISTELHALDKPIAQIQAEHAAIQPKLDRLRGIKKHIEGFLDAKSSNLQDTLALSFQSQVRKIDARLPEAVAQFDLQELTKGVMIWKAATDWLQSDENKFAKKVERHLMPQITRFLEREFAEWHEAVKTNLLPAIAVDIDKHLESEAQEYQRVLHEIEERLGIEGNTLQISDLVRNWLGGSQVGEGGEDLAVSGAGMAVLGDLGFLIAGIATDIASEILLHMSVVWIPVIGALVTAIRLAQREYIIRQEMAEKIVQGVRDKLRELELSRSARIRADVKRDFELLKSKIAGSIEAEIALIDASLQDILARKQEHEFSAEQETLRLEAAQKSLQESIVQARAALA